MPSEEQSLEALTRALVLSCRALAEAGRPRDAGRFAADGWVAVRGNHPQLARRLDGVMHHAARLEQQLDCTEPQTRRRTVMPEVDRILDVRTEIPKRRHELIFETFGELAPGAAYVLVNDHDPKPLRYQFEAELPGQFGWEYLDAGPEVWRVRISRTSASAVS